MQNGRRAGNGELGVKRKREGQGKNGNGKDKNYGFPCFFRLLL